MELIKQTLSAANSFANPLAFENRRRILFQFTRAGSWKRMVARSELPEEIQVVLYKTIKPIKLMRFEKAEIASELVDHFDDGLKRGIDADQLIEDFGDPAVTAPLMQSNKRKNRPVIVKLLRASLACGGILLAAFLVLQAFYYSASPNPSVAYDAIENEKLAAIPDSDKGWLVYRDAWTKYQLSEGGSGHNNLGLLLGSGKGAELDILPRPTDENWPAVETKLDEIADLLATFREGAKRPILGSELWAKRKNYSSEDFRALFPQDNYLELQDNDDSWGIESFTEADEKLVDGCVIGILLPHFQNFRTASRLLIVDTRRAIADGDQQRVLDNIETIFGIGRQVSSQKILVGTLIGFAVNNLGLELVEEIIDEHSGFLSDANIERLQAITVKPDLRSYVSFEFERTFFLDIVQRVYSDDGHGDGRLTPQSGKVFSVISGLCGFNAEAEKRRGFSSVVTMFTAVGVLAGPSRKQFTETGMDFYDAAAVDMATPFWESPKRDLDNFFEDKSDFEVLTLGQLLPANTSIKRYLARALLNQDAIVTAIAAQRFRRKFDRWPESMEVLNDHWLAKTPIDQWTGEPLKMRVRENGSLVVYSVGADKVDDGATPTPEEFDHFDKIDGEPASGDLVLWESNVQ